MADLPTSFAEIEDHKENIQPLRSGRSARALASSLSPLSMNPHSMRSEHSAKQMQFEEELKTASELDDPLEVWVRYVNWTIETFPSGNSPDSGMVKLLERATRQFQGEAHYKNDPRYLKLWIHYIQNFSDAPRENFAFLARHDIGQRLALFYEEYAALLEGLDRRKQANEIYQLGIENNARPVERLYRKYEEFRHRLEANPLRDDEPSSPALTAVRPALAAKPFGGSALDGPPGNQQEQQQQPMPPPKKPVRQKMAIFSDAGNPSPSSSSTADKPTGGWQNIGSLEHRKKENTQEPRPWAGEIMKQQGGTRAPSGEDKLMVFKDSIPRKENNLQSSTSSSSSSNKRPERVAVDLESIYPEDDPSEEFSFEELRAISRGLYGINWKNRREEEAEEGRERRKNNKIPVLQESRAPITVKTVLSPSPNKGKVKRKGQAPASPTMTFHTRAATDEIYSIFNQPLAKKPEDPRDSDEDSASDREDYTTATQLGPTEELGRAEEEEEEDDDAGSVKSEWSDFTLRRDFQAEEKEQEEDVQVQATTKGFGKLAIHKDEEPEQQQENRMPPSHSRIRMPSPPEDFDPPRSSGRISKDPQCRLPFMTPIVERTESLPPTTARRKAHITSPSRSKMPAISDDAIMSSPFQEEVDQARTPPAELIVFQDKPPSQQPELVVFRDRKPLAAKKPTPAPAPLAVKELSSQKGPIIPDLQCNPMDEVLRNQIFEKLQPPLKSYDGYYEYPGKKFGRSAEIKRFMKLMSKRDGERTTTNIPTQPVIEFITGDGGGCYTMKKELGKGAFAPVYLAENNTIGDLEDEAEEEEADGDGDENAASLLSLRKKPFGRKRWEAVKMEHPPTAWEFYIMRQARRRLGVSRAVESIIQAHELHIFADECYLVLEYRDQGTLLDLINLSKADSASTGVVDEILVMFITVELLRTIEVLHTKGILHGDLKSDNCLIRFDPIPDNDWTPRYKRDGTGGWSSKGISLIDFGRGIDMKTFHPTVQFIADWKTDAQDCAEMREMRPWTYQVDYHGLAAIIHSMLFGKYIDTVAERGGLGAAGGGKAYRISTGLKRYWQQDIWSGVFDVLLNPLRHVGAEENGVLPVTRSIKRCREAMEEWLEGNCEKGVGLKALVKRTEMGLKKR